MDVPINVQEEFEIAFGSTIPLENIEAYIEVDFGGQPVGDWVPMQ